MLLMLPKAISKVFFRLKPTKILERGGKYMQTHIQTHVHCNIIIAKNELISIPSLEVLLDTLQHTDVAVTMKQWKDVRDPFLSDIIHTHTHTSTNQNITQKFLKFKELKITYLQVLLTLDESTYMQVFFNKYIQYCKWIFSFF